MPTTCGAGCSMFRSRWSTLAGCHGVLERTVICITACQKRVCARVMLCVFVPVSDVARRVVMHMHCVDARMYGGSHADVKCVEICINARLAAVNVLCTGAMFGCVVRVVV